MPIPRQLSMFQSVLYFTYCLCQLKMASVCEKKKILTCRKFAGGCIGVFDDIKVEWLALGLTMSTDKLESE